MTNKELEELNTTPDNSDVSEDYNEEEDEDFDPTKIDSADHQNESDSEVEIDNKKEPITNQIDYSKIESDTGGLIKTRRARYEEAELNKKRKYENIQGTPISDTARNIWEDMKLESKKRLSRHQGSNISVIADPRDISQNAQEIRSGAGGDIEQITIERTYKFAGETIHEKKTVPKYSAEGQEYLKNNKFQKTKDVDVTVPDSKTTTETTEERSNLRRPLRREPILEKIIAGSIKPKLTTLEKSKLDWVNYVDKEGITDDLQLHNRDGYLAKQDFLDRVETQKDKKYKEFRKTQLAMQLQNQQK